MARLVVGDEALLVVTEDAVGLRAAGHPVHRLLDLLVADGRPLAAGGEERGLVDDVGELRSREPRRAVGDRHPVELA